MNIEKAEERYSIISSRLNKGLDNKTAAPVESLVIEAFFNVVKAYKEDKTAPCLIIPKEKYRITKPYKKGRAS